MIRHYRTVFGEKIYLEDEKWNHIAHKHPEVKRYIGRVREVLVLPDVVKLSKRDANFHLYYRFYHDIFNGKYLLVVTNRGRKSISTIFITDKIKVGETIWPGR